MKNFKSFLSEDKFNRSRTGWIIMSVNLLLSINSAWFFLGMMKTSVPAWLMLNSCAPSIYLFVIGYLFCSSLLITAAAVMMFRWGFLGMFFFSWSGPNLIAQISHIAMTIAVIYVVYVILKQKKIKSLAAGLILGAVITTSYSVVQNSWFEARPGYLEQFFQGQAKLPE